MSLTSKFVSSIRIGTVPLSVDFSNTSVGDFSSVLWSFGDGGQSTKIHPSHIFTSPGLYNVTLTIYSEDGESNSTTSQITAISSKSTQSGSTSQQSLYVHKRFKPGEVAVKKQTLTGTDFITSVPFSSSTAINRSKVFECNIVAASLTGSNVIAIDRTVEIFHPLGDGAGVDFTIDDNAVLMLMLAASGGGIPTFSGTMATPAARPVLTYKIVGSVDDTSNFIYLTLDRNTPLHYGQARGLIVSEGNGFDSFTIYYSDTGASHINQLTVLDSLNTFDANTTTLTGASYNGRGEMSNLGYESASGTQLVFLSPAGSATTTSDYILPGSIFIKFPFVLWHNSQAGYPGISLYDSAGIVERDLLTNRRFKYLRDSTNESGNIVGKVFYDSKFVVIDDQELSAALTYQSNRNWTFPRMSVNVYDSGAPTWISGYTGQSLFLTYQCIESGTTLIGSARYGIKEPMHCRYVKKVDLGLADYAKAMSVTIPTMQWSTGGTNCIAPIGGTVSGVNFVVDQINVLATTAKSDGYPDPAGWKVVSTISGTGISSTTLKGPISTGLTVDYSLCRAYSLPAGSTGNSYMTVGLDVLAPCYFSGTWASDVYKMSAICVAGSNEFNTTQNETYSSGSTYVSEVGIYNDTNDLLMVGKLSTPLEKNNTKFLTVKIELDI